LSLRKGNNAQRTSDDFARHLPHIFSVISHKNSLTGDSPKPKGNGFGTTAVNIAAKPACMIFAQSDKKSEVASDAGSCAVLP
jgi:hypothetical protein